MNDYQLVLLRMLSNELFNVSYTTPNDEFDLDGVIELANKHSVSLLVYEQIAQQYGKENKCVQNLRSKTIVQVIRNNRLMSMQRKVVSLLLANDIACAILKGSSIAVYYPTPSMRALGDIDILVGPQEIDRAGAVLLGAGFIYSGPCGGDPWHECYEGAGVHIELHRAVSKFPQNAKGEYASEFMSHALSYVGQECLENDEFPILTVNYQLIALLVHMQRHMITIGIGLRQLCDWAITLQHYRNAILKDAITIIDNCGLLKFAKVITAACVKYLGLSGFDWVGDVDDKTIDSFMEEIITAGNMQNLDNTRSFSSLLSTGEEIDHTKRTMIGRYIRNINKKAKRDYPGIINIPLLLPFFWFFYPLRWCAKNIFCVNKRVSISSTLSIARKRRALYCELGLYK